MKLQEKPFKRLKAGDKRVELRLYDQKRRTLFIDDKILFTNLSNPDERLAVRIRALHMHRCFRELLEVIPPSMCGFTKDTTIDEAVGVMRKYYSQDENNLGILGIEVEICNVEELLSERDLIYEAMLMRYFPDWLK